MTGLVLTNVTIRSPGGSPLFAPLTPPGEEITGSFRDVDEDGRLVLSTPHGPRRIAAGDIFF